MIDEDGYYLDPTLVHLNNEVLKRKIKKLEAEMKLVIDTLGNHQNALRDILITRDRLQREENK